jgi:hypothetical protein
MTCIVGIVAPSGAVIIGGDSAGVAGIITQQVTDPKVFRNGPYLIGYTSSFRMGQILQYSDLPELPVSPDAFDRFMRTAFVDAIRGALKDAGWATKESEQESGGTFLVGVLGRLFEVHSDYQVTEMAEGYVAIGCGEQFALGSLHSTQHEGVMRRVTMALEAAEYFCTGVRAPFTILSVGGHDEVAR